MTEEKYNTKDIRHINKKNQEYIAENNRMTEKIELTTEVLNCDYFNRNRGFNCYKGKNCMEAPDCYYRQLKHLEQENKDFEILAKSLYERIEELEKENEALAFRERLYKTGYKASERENKEIYENGQIEITKLCNEKTKYRSVLEDIRKMVTSPYTGKPRDVLNIINEVLQCG